MDGLGEEVTQKIRSAIEAKLMELGICVEDELPEYIMVMVGNKRSQAQMTNDLDLFLGSNTVPFTTWLYQVLNKLQEVTIPGNTKPKIPEKAVEEKEKAPQGRTEGKPAETVRCRKRERTPSVEEQDYLNIRADTEADPIDDLQTTSSVVVEAPARKKIAVIAPSCEEIESPESRTKQITVKTKPEAQTLKPSAGVEKRKWTDEPTKEDGMKRRRVSSPVREKEKDLSRTSSRTGSESGKREKIVFDARELLNRRKAEKSVPDTKRRREADERRKSPPTARRKSSSGRERERERERSKRSTSRELSNDRRRPPSKVVRVDSAVRSDHDEVARIGRTNMPERSRSLKSSLSGRDSESEREREKELTVPSVVKVTPRPVRPTNQQPSSSLILKAMAEANKSLAQQASNATKTANTTMDNVDGESTESVLRKPSSEQDEDVTPHKRSTSSSSSSVGSGSDSDAKVNEDSASSVVGHKMAVSALGIALKYARQQNASDDDLCVLEKWLKYSKQYS